MNNKEQDPCNTNPILIRLRPFFESCQRIVELSRGTQRSKIRGFRIILNFNDGTKRWIWLNCPRDKFKSIFESAQSFVIERAKRQLRW